MIFLIRFNDKFLGDLLIIIDNNDNYVLDLRFNMIIMKLLI